MWTNRINYFLLMIMLIVAMRFYNHPILFVMIIAMIIAPIASIVLTYAFKKNIKIKLKYSKTSVGKNNPVDVIFGVENNTLIPIENVTLFVKVKNTFYENIQNYKLIMPSTILGERIAKLCIENVYCGKMNVEVNKVYIYDLFGLARFRLYPECQLEIMVMPYEHTELKNIPLSTKGKSEDEELQSKKGDDVSQISEIRNYIPGDKLQNIHWKLTAKEGELQVKEYSMPYSEEVILLVETFINKETPWIFDEIIEKAFAISDYFIKSGRRFVFAWYDAKRADFEEKEINNNDELLAAIIDFYYVKSPKDNGMSAEIYSRINENAKGIVLYLVENGASNISGENIDIQSERVVLSCLD